MKYFFIAPLLIALSACNLSNSATKNEVGLSKKQLKEVAIIGDVGHNDGSLFSENIYSNSFESIEIALNASKGVQVDIQISKDSTLWLFGEKKIRDCKFQEFKSLSEYNDEQLKFTSICWYEKQLIPLDSFIHFMNSAAFQDKIISFDLQSMSDPITLIRFGGEEKLAEIMARKLAVLNQLEGLTFVVELPSIKAIQVFEKQSNFTPYLRTDEQSKINNYPRISVSVNRLNEINPNNIKSIQLRGANTASQLLDGIKSGIRIIQTNDLEMAKFIQNGSNLKSKIIAKDSLNKSEPDTLFSASLTENQINEDFMLQLIINEEVNLTKATLYFQGFNEDGHEVFWEGATMHTGKQQYLKFFSSNDLEKKGCTKLLVYIWSQNLPKIYSADIELRKIAQ